MMGMNFPLQGIINEISSDHLSATSTKHCIDHCVQYCIECIDYSRTKVINKATNCIILKCFVRDKKCINCCNNGNLYSKEMNFEINADSKLSKSSFRETIQLYFY